MKNVLLLLLFFNILLPSCNENDGMKPDDSMLEIYFIEEYEADTEFEFSIRSDSIIIADEPFLDLGDIAGYDREEYRFTLTEEARSRLNDLFEIEDFNFKAFALYCDGRLLYTAFFWFPFSSMMCSWLVAYPDELLEEGVLDVDYGYPEFHESFDFPDNRNTESLLNLMKESGKL